jgi:hypothetical protein
MANKRERALSERRPGRLLRDRPFLHAVMSDADMPPLEAFEQAGIPQGEDDENPWLHKTRRANTPEPPASSKEMSRIYGAADTAADLMALSKDGAGLESVSTVKTETSVRREEENETTASRIGKVMD